jgi:hypothetical protein
MLPTLLLPAALVDPGWLGPARVAALGAAPGWGALARRATLIAEAGPPDGPPPAPGHERWLQQRLGLPEGTPIAACAALFDAAQMYAADLPGGHTHAPDATASIPPARDAGPCWRIDPVHLHVGRDHLVLTDPASLALSAHDAAELAAAIATLFIDEGLSLHAGAGPRWVLVERDAARPLRLATRSMLGALGRSIELWQPLGNDARRWRRLVNEVQMTWHDHPVNTRREQAGRLPINSVWIEGPCPRLVPGMPPPPGLDAAARIAARPPGSGAFTVVDGEGPLEIDDRLLAAQIAGDPRHWEQAWLALDAHCFGPLARAEGAWREGGQLVLAGDAGWRALRITPRADWRFWRRPAGAVLLAEPAGHATPGAASAIAPLGTPR